MCRHIRGIFLLLCCWLWAGEVGAAKSCASYLVVSPHLVERLEKHQLALRPRHLPRAWQKIAKMHPIFYGKRALPTKLPSQLAVRRSLHEIVEVLDWIAIYGVRMIPATRDLLSRISVATAALYWEQRGIEYTLIKDTIHTPLPDIFPWSIDLPGRRHAGPANRLAQKIDQTYLGLRLTYAPSVLLETRSDACYYTKHHQIFVPHSFILRPSLKNGSLLHELRHARTTINWAQQKKFAWYGSVLNTQNVPQEDRNLYSSYRTYLTFDEVLIHYHDLRFELHRLIAVAKTKRKAQFKLLHKVFLETLHDTLALAVSAKAYLQLTLDVVQTQPEKVYLQKVGKAVMSVINLSMLPDPAPDHVLRVVMPIIKAQHPSLPENLDLLAQQLTENLAANEKVLAQVSKVIKMARDWAQTDLVLSLDDMILMQQLLPRIK
ncbi:MAG: hypothetical protein J6Y94_04740 [Bacteriovoracaceae bacterium]|nr:hypothetical protein [Bacteriovoracaceae bacterium]